MLTADKLRPRTPEDNADATRIGILHEMRHVGFGIYLHDTELFGPALVHDHILHAELGRKINVILIRGGVASGTERNPRYIPAVPPFPCNLAGLDPLRVFQFAGRGESIHDIRLAELAFGLGKHKHAPRERARSRRLRKVIRTLLHTDVAKWPVGASDLFSVAVLHFHGIASHVRLKGGLVANPSLHVPSGIVKQIRLRNAHNGTVRIFQHERQVYHLSAVRQLRHVRHGRIDRLPAALQRIAAIPAVRGIGR